MVNNFSVKIDINKTGYIANYVDYTRKAVFPPKFANFLDEQLDETTLTIKNVTDEVFEPFTDIIITLYQDYSAENNRKGKLFLKSRVKTKNNVTISYGPTAPTNDTVYITKIEYTLHMFIANDRSLEVPAGSGRYNHNLYLIEATKLLERHILESITFTNPLGNGYGGSNQGKARVHFKKEVFTSPVATYEGDFTSTFVKAIILAGNITISSPDEILNNETGAPPNGSFPPNLTGKELTGVYDSDGTKVSDTTTFTAEEGKTYTAVYKFSGQEALTAKILTLTYYITAVSNKYPLKKWTITEVINRIFDVVEPLKKGQVPIFKLEGVSYDAGGNRITPYSGLAAKLDKIISPEFTFPKMTLREALQQIGGFIHAEPRLIFDRRAIGMGAQSYTITFDKYGDNIYSDIKQRSYVTATLGTDINEFCNEIDSNADNIVNSLTWAQGVVTEPFQNGYISMRTDSAAIRLEENNNTFIPTTSGIYNIGEQKQVVCKYIPTLGNGDWDITPYIYEKADYDLLSSFNGDYPYAKAYALYYEQGQPNIKGLFFKNPDAVSPIFSQYAIINILEAVTGKNLSNLGTQIFECAFEITYLPIFNTRVSQHKQYFEEKTGGHRSIISYGQNANIIETKFYGENLKGVVARLGNVEKTYTYNLPYLFDIPQIGHKFDDNYYISNVSFEYLPTFIKTTIALSKNFNRLSQYVGINSEKRMWEVSEKQAQARQTIYTDYLVFQKEDYAAGPENKAFAKELLDKKSNNTITNADLQLMNKKEAIVSSGIVKPVISSAFGNAMTFTFSLFDNYSAGQKVIKTNGQYFGQYVPYNDFYGRFYYLNFILQNQTKMESNNPLNFPSGSVNLYPVFNKNRMIYRKDSREIPQITYELALKTNIRDFVIGSGAAKNCSLVNIAPISMQLWFFKDKLNVINSRISDEMFNNGSNQFQAYTIENKYIEFQKFDSVALNGMKSWALITKRTNTDITVEDESGNITTQRIFEGGELVFGENNVDMLKEPNAENRRIYICIKEKIENI